MCPSRHVLAALGPLVMATALSVSVAIESSNGFDFYVLAQSWQAEFCHGLQSVHFPGCAAPRSFWRTHFTLHGLWPESTTGNRPSQCSGEPFDAQKLQNAIGMEDLMTYWPNVKFNESDPLHASFWKHEWEEHGTCSGLGLVEFFQTTISLLKDLAGNLTPEPIQKNVGLQLSVRELQEAFGGANQVALRCRDGSALAEVRTCWCKDSNNRPTHQCACSSSVLRETNCRGNVYVRGFLQ